MSWCSGAGVTLKEHWFEWILCIGASYYKFQLFLNCSHLLLSVSFSLTVFVCFPLAHLSLFPALPLFLTPYHSLKGAAVGWNEAAIGSPRLCKYMIILKIRGKTIQIWYVCVSHIDSHSVLQRDAIKNSDGWCIIYMYSPCMTRNKVLQICIYELSHAQE